jgi:hypothetical protein
VCFHQLSQLFEATIFSVFDCGYIDRYRYQQFLSDISGQDIAAHHGKIQTLVSKVRDWLHTVSGADRLPSGGVIAAVQKPEEFD